MFLIKKSRIDRARAATSPAAKLAEIQSMLATAVTIELSTLPPYLSAVFSADPGSNREAVSIIQSVTVEEMLHMTLASNTLIALGGNPVINDLDALPSYPGHLPDVAPDLVVTIKSLTREHVREVFMGIERPDTTASLPGETKEEADYHRALLSNDEYVSIGQFYAEIKSQIEELAKIKPDLFEYPRVDQQVPATKYFNVQFKDNPLGYVTSLESALDVIDVIVEQGEGVQIESDPIDPYTGRGGELAHYFKFGEVAFGRRLIRDPKDPSGYSYTGEPVPLDQDKIRTIVENAALDDYPEGNIAHLPAQAFFDCFVRLLNSLHDAFNGEPEKMDKALSVMFELRLAAFKVVNLTMPDSKAVKVHGGSPFQMKRGQMKRGTVAS